MDYISLLGQFKRVKLSLISNNMLVIFDKIDLPYSTYFYACSTGQVTQAKLSIISHIAQPSVIPK